MSENDILYPRFFRIGRVDGTARDKMNVPPQFLSVHGDELPKNVKMQLPNGDECHVIFKKNKGKLYGVNDFLETASVDGECCTVFNYLGSGGFLLYVFTEGFTEVEYESNGFLDCVQDKVNGIGWKFISVCMSPSECDRGQIRIPPGFFHRFGHLLPASLNLTLPNGQVFPATYSMVDHMILGFRTFLVHDLLMLTYRGNGSFDVVLFDKSSGEKGFSGYNLHAGAMIGISWYQFKIQIQKFHLYKYCFGIDISTDFKDCTNGWTDGHHLTVYHQGNYFFLGIRKTDRRWKIHTGWLRFAKLLDLKIGDVLVFDMTSPPHGFSLEIYRLGNRQ